MPGDGFDYGGPPDPITVLREASTGSLLAVEEEEDNTVNHDGGNVNGAVIEGGSEAFERDQQELNSNGEEEETRMAGQFAAASLNVDHEGEIQQTEDLHQSQLPMFRNGSVAFNNKPKKQDPPARERPLVSRPRHYEYDVTMFA
jgi:hypothetical protein